MIEQALFTMRPGRPWDDRPAAQTSGIGEDQSQELAAALQGLQGSPDSASEALAISFFPLSGGPFCVARTAPAAGGGFTLGTILTHCLVVNRETMARYANNPFALLHAVLAEGWLRPADRGRPHLNRFTIEGGCPPLDSNLVASLIGNPGLAWFETLIDTALGHPALAFPLGLQQPRLFAALFNCLPVECRPAFSFTTGPATAEQSTFRLFCLDQQALERSRSSHERRFAVLDLAGEPSPKECPPGGWSGLVSRAIRVGRVDWLAEQLCVARPGLRSETLDALGSELLQSLATLERGEPPRPAAAGFRTSVFESRSGSTVRRPDVAHDSNPSALPFTATAVATSPAPLETDPSQVLGREHPRAMQRLEQLDDVVFEAIAGKPAALEQLRGLWPVVTAELGHDLLEESQSQYLRHALSVWKDCIAGDELRNPRLAVAAAEVISILLGVT